MQDYKKLVEALRYCAETPEEEKDCNLCDYYPKCSDVIAKEAADAIEALQARVKELTNECVRLIGDRLVLESVQGKYGWVCPNCGTEIRLYGEMEAQDGE